MVIGRLKGSTESRLELIMKEPTEEVITVEELRKMLEEGRELKHYIGIEISGPLHLGSLVLVGLKLRDLYDAGIKVTIFLADWHSYINEKLGKDMELIRAFSEFYKMAFTKFINRDISFVLGSELYDRNKGYWEDMLRLATSVNTARVMKSLTVAGREESESLTFAQLIYPVMQVNDIHALDVDIAHGGTDQRKAHMLARDVFPRLGWKVPVAIHHHLLPGLGAPQGEFSKMSKSKPETAIFIHDSDEEIKQKLAKAYCPPKVLDGNPVVEIARYIVLPVLGRLNVERSLKYGGDIAYNDYATLSKDYLEGRLHPLDLKVAVARGVSAVIGPLRDFLVSNGEYVSALRRVMGGTHTS